MTNIPHLEDWYLVAEAAELLGVSKQTIHNMIHGDEPRLTKVRRLGPPDNKPIYLVSKFQIDQILTERYEPNPVVLTKEQHEALDNSPMSKVS